MYYTWWVSYRENHIISFREKCRIYYLRMNMHFPEDVDLQLAKQVFRYFLLDYMQRESGGASEAAVFC